MQSSRAKDEGAYPRGGEYVLLSDHDIEIVVVGFGSGRRQRGLLDQGVMRDVVVDGGAQVPLRTGGLGPIEPRGREIIPERHGNIVGHSDERNLRVVEADQALR